MHNFFISYTGADRMWAEWIAWQLEAAGYTSVLQAWDFLPGANFVLEMQRAAAAAERTLAVLSPDYLTARFTQPEWAAAFARDPTGVNGLVLPVRIRACDLEGLLGPIIYIDLVGLDEIGAKQTLLAGVQRGRAKPATPPTFPRLAAPVGGAPKQYPGGLSGPRARAGLQQDTVASGGRHQGCAVILTALSIEYQAIRAHLTNLREETHRSGTVYERGTFVSAYGPAWEVGIAEIGAGNPRAAMEAERAIQHFTPSVALFVGVAGGLKDVVIGDVVAATKVYGYEAGKALSTFQTRPDVGNSTYSMEQRARAEAKKLDWRQRLTRSPAATVPTVYVAPIAAGEKVIAARRSAVYKFLRSVYSDALAVEMGGRGFLYATQANPHVEAIVIRGISDLIHRKRAADAAGSQALAAQHASAFAFELLAKFRTTPQDHPTAHRLILVLSGTLDEMDWPRAEAVVEHLRTLLGDVRLTLKALGPESSVVLVLEGAPEVLDRLEALFRTGRLMEVLGMAIQDIRRERPETAAGHGAVQQTSAAVAETEESLRLFVHREVLEDLSPLRAIASARLPVVRAPNTPGHVRPWPANLLVEEVEA